MDTPTKICTKCKLEKLANEFYARNGKRSAWCKDCFKANVRLRNKEIGDAVREERTSHRSIFDDLKGLLGICYDVDSESGCWVWSESRYRNGYGCFKISGLRKLAHRVSYELYRGPIPDGLQLDHLCRNRACCNPEHLEAVTQRVNLLRGETVTAVNAAKTHCPQGHPYDEENTSVRNGSRYCRTCHRERERARRAAND